MPASAAASRPVSPYLLLTLPPLFWAINWIIGRAIHADVPPMAMTFFRWLFAILMLVPFAWRWVLRDWPVMRAHWKTLVGLGAAGVGMHNAFAYLALNHTTATNGVILNSFIPAMIIAMSWLFFRERLTRAQLAGVAVSFAGVMIIVTRGSLAALAAFRLNVGDILVLMSLLMWSIYTICLRWRPPGLHMLSFLLALAVVGDLLMLPLMIGEMALGHRMVWSPATVFALLAVALMSSILAYIFWNRGVELVGPQVAGLFVHLMPVFGVVLAWLFLDERFEVYHGAGGALILVGIWITSRRRDGAIAPAGTD